MMILENPDDFVSVVALRTASFSASDFSCINEIY